MSRLLLHLAGAAFCVLACADASARSSDQLAFVPSFDLSNPSTQALTQIDEDGSVWARGSGWKAHFRNGAVEMRALPRKGRAPARASFRLDAATLGSTRLDLDQAAVPILDGQRVTYDRGGLLETHDLFPGGVEQSFVLCTLPACGDLTIRIAVETALCARAEAAGVAFDSLATDALEPNERLGLRYGAMHIVDAAGRRLSCASELEGSDIVLRVPWAFLAKATLPVVVDPLISTLTVDGGTDDCSNPDVAFDASTSRWLVVYERAAGDEGDIISRRYDFNGLLLEELAVDITNDDTIDPAVANNAAANQFLIVWEKRTGFFNPTQKIRARTRLAASTSQGAAFNVTSSSFNEARPDVGGSPNAGDTKYLVVWQTNVTLPIPDGGDVHARTVSTSAALGSILDIDTRIGSQQFPTVTKSCGAPGIWGIAYADQRPVGGEVPVLLAFVNKAGSLLATEIDADFSGNHRKAQVQVSIAGDGRVFASTWTEFATASKGTVIGSFFAFQNGSVASLAGTFDLSAAEPGAVQTRSHTSGGIETDGVRFTYAYREQRANSTDFDIFAATIDPITGTFVEGHVSLGASIFQDDEVEIASSFGSGGTLPSRCFGVWTRAPSATDHDVIAALYSQP